MQNKEFTLEKLSSIIENHITDWYGTSKEDYPKTREEIIALIRNGVDSKEAGCDIDIFYLVLERDDVELMDILLEYKQIHDPYLIDDEFDHFSSHPVFYGVRSVTLLKRLVDHFGKEKFDVTFSYPPLGLSILGYKLSFDTDSRKKMLPLDLFEYCVNQGVDLRLKDKDNKKNFFHYIVDIKCVTRFIKDDEIGKMRILIDNIKDMINERAKCIVFTTKMTPLDFAIANRKTLKRLNNDKYYHCSTMNCHFKEEKRLECIDLLDKFIHMLKENGAEETERINPDTDDDEEEELPLTFPMYNSSELYSHRSFENHKRTYSHEYKKKDDWLKEGAFPLYSTQSDSQFSTSGFRELFPVGF